MKFRRLIGDKAFYRMVFAVAIPVMVQNGITNFVGLLDNIMVGQVGTEQMSGVAVANQLMFVFNLCIFGAISGAGIFSAQFAGRGDQEGVRYTFRFKLIICAVLCIVAALLFALCGGQLISLYLSDGSGAGDPARTLEYGKEYLWVMLLGLAPFALTQIYSSTLREMGKTVLPMKAGLAAVLVNLALNYVLIFGHFGFPAMGAVGAAAATVISRFAELLVIAAGVHGKKGEYPFIVGAYRSLRIPGRLAGQIIRRGAPLMFNEVLWSVGTAVTIQFYSVRGLAVVAGLNISTTVSNLFNIIFMAMGTAVSIIIGQMLGADETEKAVDANAKLTFFAVALCVAVGALLAAVSPFIPRLYNTTQTVRELATQFLLISALTMPHRAYTHCCYFTLRSGGKTGVTFLFDCVYLWVITVPIVYVLTHLTSWGIVPVYLICQLSDLIKCAVGFVFVKKGVWIHNIVVQEQLPGEADGV